MRAQPVMLGKVNTAEEAAAIRRYVHNSENIYGLLVSLDDKAAYSSPMLVTLGGVRQMLVFSASRLMGLTPLMLPGCAFLLVGFAFTSGRHRCRAHPNAFPAVPIVVRGALHLGWSSSRSVSS